MHLYLDAMVWIYAFENHPQFGAQARAVLQAITRNRYTLVTSHFLLSEVLVLPLRNNDAFLVAAYRRALLGSTDSKLAAFGFSTAMTCARLRAQHRIKQPDAIHLALAATAGVDTFITTDTRLLGLTIPGIGFIGDLSTTLA